MKVFISWSKNSCEFAGTLKAVMRQLFDTVETFYSPAIPAGAKWLNQIEAELTDTNFGIICVTRENQLEQWLNYEAGALSRQVEDRRERLGVLLLDFDDMNDVSGPFANFQMKMATLEDFKSLMRSLNEIGPSIAEDVLDERVDTHWPKLEAELMKLKKSDRGSTIPKRRDMHDKIDELLALVRAFDKSMNAPALTPFVVNPEERQRGREFVSKLYAMMRGRDIHFDFRPLNKTTNILDVTDALSAQEHQTIEGYYQKFFPDSSKHLVITDLAWKNQIIATAAAEESAGSSVDDKH